MNTNAKMLIITQNSSSCIRMEERRAKTMCTQKECKKMLMRLYAFELMDSSDHCAHTHTQSQRMKRAP